MRQSLLTAVISELASRRFWIATLYLALTAALGPLILFSLNVHRMTASTALVGFALLLAALAGIRLAVTIIFRRPSTTDPIIAIAAIGFLYNGLFGVLPGSPVFWLWIVAVGGMIVLMLVNTGFRRTTERSLPVFLVVLAASACINIARSEVWSDRDAIRAALDGHYPPIAAPEQEVGTRPDIFYIVFDRYARADILAERYGFDNTAFLDALRARGFVVSDDAFSPYQRTAHSLASTLNLGYIAPIDAMPSNDWVPLYERLSAPRLFSFLKSVGYQIRTYGSWWEPTRSSALADFSDAYFAVPESIRPMAEMSVLSNVLAATGIDFLDARFRHCRRIHHKFDALENLAPVDDPVFVFAHFLVPHPPFVIDRNGRCKSVAETNSLGRVKNYTAQLMFANSATLALVDTIVARNPQAVIVIQADEGPWPEKYAGEEVEAFGTDVTSPEWSDVTAGDLKEKMAVLSAIRAPGFRDEVPTVGFSPVNTFRIILRGLFGASLPDLPRRALIFKNNDALYSFENVLGRLTDEGQQPDPGAAAAKRNQKAPRLPLPAL